MAIEPKRGCGYRKRGGLYLVTGGKGRPCGKMPLQLDVCPTCHGGIKPARGWTWIDPTPLFTGRDCDAEAAGCHTCPLRDLLDLGSVGLIWIGEKFYPTPESFVREAAAMGISRRITAVPKGFKPGETWVLLAHRRVKLPTGETAPGAFYLFRPSRIEKIVTDEEARDELEMAKLEARGIVPFIVPADDPDHCPGIDGHDDDQDDLFT
jgi:hypothetical protein